MTSKVRRPMGRPRLSREEVGYESELINLARLRSAVLADSRLSTRGYMRISASIEAIEKELRGLMSQTPKETGNL